MKGQKRDQSRVNKSGELAPGKGRRSLDYWQSVAKARHSVGTEKGRREFEADPVTFAQRFGIAASDLRLEESSMLSNSLQLEFRETLQFLNLKLFETVMIQLTPTLNGGGGGGGGGGWWWSGYGSL